MVAPAAHFAPPPGQSAPKLFPTQRDPGSFARMNLDRAEALRVSWILRVGVAMEFLGHGVLGFLRPSAWIPYFALVGIQGGDAARLMPLVGSFDIALALVALFWPARGAVLCMAFWGLGTALLRPLAGESAWEAVERGGNFGAALALFLMAGGAGAASWVRFGGIGALDSRASLRVHWVLRVTTAALLLGHGALGLIERKALLGTHYAAVGLPGARVEPFIGAFECALALAVLLRPGPGLLVAVAAWKLATEALSPMAGSPVWVFVEHGGSYAAPLALALMGRTRVGAASHSPGRPAAGDAPGRAASAPTAGS